MAMMNPYSSKGGEQLVSTGAEPEHSLYPRASLSGKRQVLSRAGEQPSQDKGLTSGTCREESLPLALARCSGTCADVNSD